MRRIRHVALVQPAEKEEKSLRLAAAGKSAFCFAELHYDARSLLRAAGIAVEQAFRLYRKIDRKK